MFLEGLEDRLGVAKGSFRYVQCRTCGLISLHPIPDARTIATYYPAAFWRTHEKQRAPGMLQRLEAWYRGRLLHADFRQISSLLTPGVSHLDVGCATGDFIVLAQSHGTRSIGIEMGAEAARYCVEQRDLDVVQGDLPTHDFGDRQFDVITYNAVLEHVPNPLIHLRKCAELLAPEGKLCILGLPNIGSLGFRLSGRRWLGLDCPRHLYQFSRHSLERLLAKAGFRSESWNTRSSRLNRSLLVGSMFPALHRHAFDQYERHTGHNPLGRKLVLFALFQMTVPVDWLASIAGMGESMNYIAVPEDGRARRDVLERTPPSPVPAPGPSFT